jgi:Kef-type K+ transport system membrane component KefB
MSLPALLLEVSSHQAEVAETLIGVGEFLVIFVAARALAELMVRIQLPTILGELVAGVLIGVSGLHLIVPPETQVGSLADVSPAEVQELYAEHFANLQSVSQIGLYALLFLTGLESELDELVAVGMQATTVAVTGVVLPFVLGTAGLYYLFDVPLIPAVFAGAAMTATSIGITASVFGELKFLKTREGQTVIGAAVLDDILGIVILAVVVSLGAGNGFAVGPLIKLVVAAAVFVAAALFLSRTAAPAFDWLLDRLKAPGEAAVASFLVLSVCCFAAPWGRSRLASSSAAAGIPTPLMPR